MARICSIAGDSTLLRIRERLLKGLGHTVSSFFYREAENACASGKHDLLLLCQLIPHRAKIELISAFRTANPNGKVIAYTRAREPRLANVDCRISSGDPDELVRAIARTVGRPKERRRAARAKE